MKTVKKFSFVFIISALLIVSGCQEKASNIIDVKGIAAGFAMSKTGSLLSQIHSREIDLTIPQQLAITRPSEDIETYYDRYFITGTSNPDIPLYFEGEEVERQGSKGTFGVLVGIDKGKNNFTFTQEDAKAEITITKAIGSSEITLIDKITQSSMAPIYKTFLYDNNYLSVSCVAPSGAKVYASFNGGSEIQLEQVTSADDGVPATFAGQLMISNNVSDTEVSNLGSVSYKMMFDNRITEYNSTGELYIVGGNARPAVKVSSYFGYVYPDVNNLSEFKELWKLGAEDYITGRAGRYFTLASGGYIPISMVDILEGNINIENEVSTITHSLMEKGEYFKFKGSENCSYNVTFDEDSINLILYNSKGTPDLNMSGSELFSKYTMEEVDNTVVMRFFFNNPEDYWGYNINYDDEYNLFFEVKKRPSISAGFLPLKDITIIIDPGHGGTDPGAIGLAGESGPNEAEANLAHAYSLEKKLLDLGATVYLTQDENEYYSLDNRLRDMPVHDADFFISLHHNSVDFNQDSNTARGTEVYYHTDNSKIFAENIVENISEQTDRNNRGAFWSYYRVTIANFCPSVLVELGFITNPLEYEKACDSAVIDKTTTAITEAIVKSFAQKG